MNLFCTKKYPTGKTGNYLVSTSMINNFYDYQAVNFNYENLDFLHSGKEGFSAYYKADLFQTDYISMVAVDKNDRKMVTVFVVRLDSLVSISSHTYELE